MDFKVPSTTTTKSPEKSKATTDDTASEREVGTCIVDDHYQSEYIVMRPLMDDHYLLVYDHVNRCMFAQT